jgi:hypothetical protein
MLATAAALHMMPVPETLCPAAPAAAAIPGGEEYSGLSWPCVRRRITGRLWLYWFHSFHAPMQANGSSEFDSPSASKVTTPAERLRRAMQVTDLPVRRELGKHLQFHLS